MKKILRYLAAGIFVLLVAVGSFVLGAKSVQNRHTQIDVAFASTQAMQWFNHLLRYRELEADLSKGCSKETLEKIRISIAQEMNLLSSFYREHPNTSINKYISDRDPTLLKQLETYKSKYGNSWTEPQCAK